MAHFPYPPHNHIEEYQPMPHPDKNPDFILSAGEIGAYTVCPEAWRLRRLHPPRQKSAAAKEGLQRHEEWSRNLEEALYLAKSSRIISMLLLLAIVILLLVRV